MLTKIFGIAMAMAMGVVLGVLGALIPTAPPRGSLAPPAAAGPQMDRDAAIVART